jgi:hypothetical protein
LQDGAEYKKYFKPNAYLNIENKNLEILEVVLPKKYPLDYIKYLHFTAIGDKSIDLTAWNAQKNANDFKIDLYFVAPSHTFLPFAQYPLFATFPNLSLSNEGYAISIFYEIEENEKIFRKISRKTKIVELEPTPEPEPAPVPEPTQDQEPFRWLWAVLLFFIVLITLQKASNN